MCIDYVEISSLSLMYSYAKRTLACFLPHVAVRQKHKRLVRSTTHQVLCTGRSYTWQMMKINEQSCYGETWDFTGPVERLLKAISNIMAYSRFGVNDVGKKLLTSMLMVGLMVSV
ncbi:hypothetical protein XENOCAPTIV_004797 [Xenoophorus captivus]|uniref:Uncharacterized protein n=1 Tax=Xenoophorus captivus TaxID=1517983 RepID=A0ABV0RQH4_9TELE